LTDGGILGEENDSGEDVAGESQSAGDEYADDFVIFEESGEANHAAGEGDVEEDLQGVDKEAADEQEVEYAADTSGDDSPFGAPAVGEDKEGHHAQGDGAALGHLKELEGG